MNPRLRLSHDRINPILKGSGEGQRIGDLRETRLFGTRQEHSFRNTATKFLTEHQHKRSLERDARALRMLDPFIGELPLRRVHPDTLQPFIRSRLNAGVSPGTANWRTAWCE